MTLASGTRRWICVALAGLAACSRGDGPPAATMQAHLGIAGRTNANASLAAEDSLVVVAWSASTSNSTDVYTAVSRDAGRTFGNPVRVNDVAGDARINSEFPPRVVFVARAGGPPDLVVVWTTKRGNETRIQSARSTDVGSTYSAAAPIPGGVAPGNRGWESVAVDSAGRVLVMWLDHRDVSPMEAMHHHGGDASGSMAGMSQDPTERAAASKLYFAALGDRAPVVITGSVCYCCKTSLVARGASVYGVWRHVYPGTHRNIAFTQSHDGGKTFSAPVQVSDDHWQIDGCPENGPAIAVDDRIHVAWATPPDGKSETPLGVFYATSGDGSRFARRAAMPTRGLGSHAQVVSEGTGSVVVAWDELVGTERQIGLARVTSTRDGDVPDIRRLWGDAAVAGGWPVLARAGTTTLVAWVSKTPSKSEIVVTPLQ